VNAQLMAMMRANPGASASTLAGLLGLGVGAVCGRWSRLGKAGLLVKCANGRWRLPTPDDHLIDEIEEASEFETIERARPAYDRTRWVQPINYFVRIETGFFDCRRFG
jgi:hypothetical protein